MISDDVERAAEAALEVTGDWRQVIITGLLAYHRSRTYTPEEVDAVARAIYADSYTNYGTCSEAHWSKTSDVQRDFCRGQARAALAAGDAYRIAELEKERP